MTSAAGPTSALIRRPRFHSAWVVLAVTFAALLVSAGIRAAPGALIRPLEVAFGWDRSSISLVVAISILAYGLGAPLGGSLVDRFGPRRVMTGGLLAITSGLAGMLAMTAEWQFLVLWGLVVGMGTGVLSSVLGATIALR